MSVVATPCISEKVAATEVCPLFAVAKIEAVEAPALRGVLTQSFFGHGVPGRFQMKQCGLNFDEACWFRGDRMSASKNNHAIYRRDGTARTGEHYGRTSQRLCSEWWTTYNCGGMLSKESKRPHDHEYRTASASRGRGAKVSSSFTSEAGSKQTPQTLPNDAMGTSGKIEPAHRSEVSCEGEYEYGSVHPVEISHETIFEDEPAHPMQVSHQTVTAHAKTQPKSQRSRSEVRAQTPKSRKAKAKGVSPRTPVAKAVAKVVARNAQTVTKPLVRPDTPVAKAVAKDVARNAQTVTKPLVRLGKGGQAKADGPSHTKAHGASRRLKGPSKGSSSRSASHGAGHATVSKSARSDGSTDELEQLVMETHALLMRQGLLLDDSLSTVPAAEAVSP